MSRIPFGRNPYAEPNPNPSNVAKQPHPTVSIPASQATLPANPDC